MSVGEQVRASVPPLGGINQTSFAFGAIMFAYLFFVTVRGDLGKWLGVLGLAGTTGKAASNTPAGTTPASTPATAANNDAGNSLPAGSGNAGGTQVADNSAPVFSSGDMPDIPTMASTNGQYGIIV